MLALQTNLALRQYQRTALVTTETAADKLECDSEAVIDWAQTKYRWVWDVSILGALGKIRELRFWKPELESPSAVAGLSVPQVLGSILGGRENFHPGEVQVLLRITRPTRLDLQKTGGLIRPPGSLFYPRTSLEKFLTNRLIHGNQQTVNN